MKRWNHQVVYDFNDPGVRRTTAELTERISNGVWFKEIAIRIKQGNKKSSVIRLSEVELSGVAAAVRECVEMDSGVMR